MVLVSAISCHFKKGPANSNLEGASGWNQENTVWYELYHATDVTFACLLHKHLWGGGGGGGEEDSAVTVWPLW